MFVQIGNCDFQALHTATKELANQAGIKGVLVVDLHRGGRIMVSDALDADVTRKAYKMLMEWCDIWLIRVKKEKA